MNDETYDFVDPDLPEKREVRKMMEEKHEEGVLFGPDNAKGERLPDDDRELLRESGHLPPEGGRVDIEEHRTAMMERESEPLGKLCADPEQMEDAVDVNPPAGYSDKAGGSYQQRGFISRCLNRLRSLL